MQQQCTALQMHCHFQLYLNTCEEFRFVQKYVYIQVTQVSYLLEQGVNNY